MSTKSKHTVKIYPSYEISNDILDGLIVLPSGNGKMSNTVNPFAYGSHQTAQNLLRTLMPDMGIKTLYYQTTRNNKVSTKKVEIIEFSNYDENEHHPEYKGKLDLVKFEELLMKNTLVSFDVQEESVIQQYFDKIDLKNDMVFDIQFISSKGIMKLVTKKIKRKIDDRLVPYYDENNASVYEATEAKSILGHQHFIFEEKNGSYLKIHNYNQLGLQVYTTINPDENKVVPAVIVEDMKGNAIEVFCYYKKELISKDVLFELKPNLLKENFRKSDYFTNRDIEFLDMLNI